MLLRALFIVVLMLNVSPSLAINDGVAADQLLDELGGSLQAQIDGETLAFPVLKTAIDADIQGDLATVTVRQTFSNPLHTPVHATYLFPLNQDAAVYEMLMEVGDERIQAQIKRIEEARATFVQAKQEGRSAALLQQQRPNMFTQDIANLMPSLPIQVTLRYVQTVPKVDGDYEMVIPLVVGPRFQPAGAGQPPPQMIDPQVSDLQPETVTPQAAENQTVGGVSHWNVTNPPALAGGATGADSRTAFGQWELEELPAYPPVFGLNIPDTIDPDRVALTIKLNGGMPIQHVASETHRLIIDQLSTERWHLSLQDGATIDNRDFVLRYQLAGDQNQAGLLAYRDERGGFFSLLLEPPAMPDEAEIARREIVFVLDCSGSMSGLPMEASKALARRALQKLRPGDTFRIIRFSDAATEFSTQPVLATPANIQHGIQYLNGLRGSGGTHMRSGILQALSVPVPAGTVRLVWFLTDGYIGNEFEILQLIEDNLDSARLFSFGVGTSINRYLLAEMGRVGRGFVRYMDPTERVEEVAEELSERLQSPVLTDISIDWGDLQPLEISPEPIPDLFAGQSVRLAGRYEQAGTYHITVRGKVAGRQANLPLAITLPEQSQDGQAIALLWARAAVKQAMHQFITPLRLRSDGVNDDTLKQRVVQLGLDFSLVTRWTSFVAVSKQIYNPNPAATTTQPIPVPQVKGVTAAAYGNTQQFANGGTQAQFAGGAAPEPAMLAGLLLMVLVLGGFMTMRQQRFSMQWGNVQ
ncbi:MAG: VWA domain-containing protein [Candidatus Competibacteraceae bacterium]|nr:VWA domain-containing protein [Candidatus Competibacteraceae bacterium]